jgi:hypothetical protein
MTHKSKAFGGKNKQFIGDMDASAMERSNWIRIMFDLNDLFLAEREVILRDIIAKVISCNESMKCQETTSEAQLSLYVYEILSLLNSSASSSSNVVEGGVPSNESSHNMNLMLETQSEQIETQPKVEFQKAKTPAAAEEEEGEEEEDEERDDSRLEAKKEKDKRGGGGEGEDEEAPTVLGKGNADYMIWKKEGGVSFPVLVIEVKLHIYAVSASTNHLKQLVGYVKGVHQQYNSVHGRTTHGLLCDLVNWQFVTCSGTDFKIEVFRPLEFLTTTFTGSDISLHQGIRSVLKRLETIFEVKYSKETSIARSQRYTELSNSVLESDMCKRLKDNLAGLKDNLAASESEKVRLKDNLAGLKDNLAASESEKVRLKDNLAESESEKVTLKDNLAESESEKVTLKDNLAESESEKVTLKDNLAAEVNKRQKI